jgi:hypothetical protein
VAECVVGRDLRRDLLGSLVSGGVQPLREKLARFVAPVPRLGESGFGKRPEPEHVRLAVETVAEAPELRAARLNQQVQPLAVGEAVRLLPRLRILNAVLGERHVSTPFSQLYSQCSDKPRGRLNSDAHAFSRKPLN